VIKTFPGELNPPVIVLLLMTGPEEAETAGKAIDTRKAMTTRPAKKTCSGFHPLVFVGLVGFKMCPSLSLLSIFAFVYLHFIILRSESWFRESYS